jgi:hypothetical protein
LNLKAELTALNSQLEDAIQRLTKYETEPKSKAFAKIVDLLAPAGVPGLVLLAAMAISVPARRNSAAGPMSSCGPK